MPTSAEPTTLTVGDPLHSLDRGGRGPLVRSGPVGMTALIWLVLCAPGALACGGFLGCLREDLLQAFSRIAASDSYTLVPGLTFDRRPSPVPRHLLESQPPLAAGGLADVYRGAERLFQTHSLFWNVLPGVDVTVSEKNDGDFVLGVQRCRHSAESRTFKFGMMRRMKLIMLPIMYKLGVITTLLTLLTVFALKGLTIGVLLLVMTSAGLAAKFKYYHYPHGQLPAGKEVHVHVHGSGGSHSYHPPLHYDDPWVRQDRPSGGGYIQHQPPPPPPPVRSTSSPWASYIGDQSI